MKNQEIKEKKIKKINIHNYNKMYPTKEEIKIRRESLLNIKNSILKDAKKQIKKIDLELKILDNISLLSKIN